MFTGYVGEVWVSFEKKKNSIAMCLFRNTIPVSLNNSQSTLSTIFIGSVLLEKVVLKKSAHTEVC